MLNNGDYKVSHEQLCQLSAAHKRYSIRIWPGHLNSTIEEKKSPLLELLLTVLRENHLQKGLMGGTNLPAHTVLLCLPKWERANSGSSSGKASSCRSACGQPGCCCPAGSPGHRAQRHQLGSPVVSSLACGIRDGAVSPREQLHGTDAEHLQGSSELTPTAAGC